ncbi:GNAT family N-acetyltransferase [Undibacterium sp. Tian12W]|uniref:GNAT family N-acetyltransferase n=1 Tax=Undibacterium sp. Tian12W TaxID=3413054 RepID=UPI003BF10F72
MFGHLWKVTCHLLIAVESDLPLAYCWGTLNSHSSVLEVQPGYRGRGIGREMVAFMLMVSVKNRNPLLEIQCAPETSAVFWESMGFTTYTICYKVYGRRVLDMPRQLPDGDPISVKISFFPSYFSGVPGEEPLAVQNLLAVEIPGTKRLMLSRIVAHYYQPD